MNNDNKDNIFKSSFFLKLFGIPSISWIVLLLVAMIPNETEADPLTWGDMIIADITILLIWFIISFVIALIVNGIKKNKIKTVVAKDIQYIDKPTDKIVVAEESNKEIKIESKKQLKKKSNDKTLYTCESVIDAYEYKRMAKYFPKRTYWVFVLRSVFYNLIFSAILAITSRSLIETLLFFVIYQIYLMIYYKIRLEYCLEKAFNSRLKKGLTDSNFKIDFCDEFFTMIWEMKTIKIKYSDITKCVETDTNFYLEYALNNMIVIIQKNRCDLELINFIREKYTNSENQLGDDIAFKGVKKIHNPRFIRNAMTVLFILTIISEFGAQYTWILANIITHAHGFNFTKTAWVIWLWLPIPILSIILGFKYKKEGFKCTKNIVAGFFIGIFLLFYGSIWLLPTFSEDYSKLDNYKTIIDAELPINGELEIQELGTYLDEDKTEYTIIKAYYDAEDTTKLVNSIENNDNWILSTDIKSELKIFIPTTFHSNKNAYLSIYNKTLDEYNSVPENAGYYEIYTMRYDISKKHLEIHKFKYSYK